MSKKKQGCNRLVHKQLQFIAMNRSSQLLGLLEISGSSHLLGQEPIVANTMGSPMGIPSIFRHLMKKQGDVGGSEAQRGCLDSQLKSRGREEEWAYEVMLAPKKIEVSQVSTSNPRICW
jgi:hypothetical protein